VNGYLAMYKSADNLAYGIQWALDSDLESGKNARKKVLEKFNNEIVARQYMDLYQSVLNG
jgi:hypothetical protein